jgi:glycosyltransferase involved in cell wall biosynthesis
MNPKISVLMPVYNTKEKHLREAIESVLNQTFKDFEFLIINDASTDKNTAAVVKSYMTGDSRIKYFENERNLGITPTRNKLINTAKGEYLAVTDHDDISLPQRFEKEAEFLDKNPQFGVVGCFVKFFDESKNGSGEWKNRGGTAKYPTEDEDIKMLLLLQGAIIHPACMIRKSVLTDNGIFYEEEFSPAEDFALFCRLIPHTKFHNLPKVLFKYRWHSSNTTTTQQQKIAAADLKIRSLFQKKHPDFLRKLKDDVPFITFVKLLSGIPFLKIQRSAKSASFYLFYFLPLLEIKKGERKNKVLLFSLLPIFTYKTRKVLKGIYVEHQKILNAEQGV